MNYVVYSSENVVLTHVIKCKIDVQEFPKSSEKKYCSVCKNDAEVFCKNDLAYFCAHCDYLAHEGDDNED